jgi:hypothetical protein
MPHSKQLHAAHRAKVAEQIGRLVARHGLGTTKNARHELGESFEIHVLRPRTATESTRLAKLLHPSGQWHCQIQASGKPAGFARCTEPSGNSTEWGIHSLFQSHLAEKIAIAVHQIDKAHAEREAEVKLFFAPNYHLYGFLLEHARESHVLVIDSPFPRLKAGDEFTEAEFLKRLQEIRPIRGLVPGRIPTITITPLNVSLTEMKSASFQVHDDQGNSLSAMWSIAPGVPGTLAPSAIAAPSAMYTAPPMIGAPQAITITAIAGGASASTNVLLTPVSVQLIPVTAQLRSIQTQQFVATVSGDPTNAVTWLLSPNVGTIKDGLYAPPTPMVGDSTSVKVMAISALGQKTASATITLIPPPWAGWKRNLLAAYLLTVFLLTFLLVRLWPPSGPDPLLTAARQAAQATVDADEANLKKAKEAVPPTAVAPPTAPAAKPANKATPAAPATSPPTPGASPATEAATDARTLEALSQKKAADEKALQDAKDKENASIDPLDRGGPNGLAKRLGATLPREVDLLLLVLVGGALGAFLHCVRSFVAFAGNEELKGSWAWWYYFHPFLGATLALASYLALRGGFLVIGTGTTTKTSELNPFALTGVALLVGMFSKNAITKLAELFDTLFQPSNPKTLQAPLGHTSVPSVLAPPKINSVTPTSGPAAGGTSITIGGSGFNAGATVNIGGVVATNTTIVNTTSIVTTTPPHLAGDAAVEVVNPDGQRAASSIGYRYV